MNVKVVIHNESFPNRYCLPYHQVFLDGDEIGKIIEVGTSFVGTFEDFAAAHSGAEKVLEILLLERDFDKSIARSISLSWARSCDDFFEFEVAS